MVVYTPQFYENYQLQSGEGVSLLFIAIWLVADTFNLAGAILGNLIPTVIILGVYVSPLLARVYHLACIAHTTQYTACDLILLGQIYYYRWKNAHKPETASTESRLTNDDEETPLLSVEVEQTPRPESVVEPLRVLAVKYTIAVLFIISVGIAAWWINEGRYRTPDLHGLLSVLEQHEKPKYYAFVQFCGWTSAILFVRSVPSPAFHFNAHSFSAWRSDTSNTSVIPFFSLGKNMLISVPSPFPSSMRGNVIS